MSVQDNLPEPFKKAKITIIDYDEASFQEKVVETVKECLPFREKPTVTWINVDSLQSDVVQEMGTCFSLHSLTVEDILNTQQRPKIEDFTDYLFIVLKMVDYCKKEKKITTEHVSIVFGRNFVISFQENEGDVFNPVRERIRAEKTYIRKMKTDYLAYSLIDAVVDNYFAVLETLGEYIEDREEELLRNPTLETLQTIQALKKEMIGLRRSVWPLREVISILEKGESPLIEKTTTAYLRDVYDHSIEVIETIETYRDMLSEMLDIYISTISNRMNEIMKVLTIIATIFIPLTFIVGIYGMNFRYMPEIEWEYGYPLVMVLMLFVGLLMVVYFRKEKWL